MARTRCGGSDIIKCAHTHTQSTCAKLMLLLLLTMLHIFVSDWSSLFSSGLVLLV